MNVLFITRKWPPAVGGMELYCKELVTGLQEVSNVKLEVLALKGSSNGNAPGLVSILFFVVRAAVFLIRNGRRFDVVHFGDFVLFPLAILDRWLCRSRVRCMTVYGLDLTYGRKKGMLPWIYRGFVKLAVARRSAIDCYIAISRFTGQLAENVGLHPVVVIPLGIRMESFDAALVSKGESRSERYVFYLGRVVRRKGAFWFAESVLPRFKGEIEFYVAGRFYSASEQQYLSSLPNVKVLGQIPQSEALAYRKNAIATVMPNIRIENSADVEGFGLTAVEAPAAGSILIASRLEGIEDAVIDRVTGLLAEPGDIDEWEEKLRDVMAWDSTRRETFVRNARKALRQHYNWGQVAERTADVYQTAVTRKTFPN